MLGPRTRDITIALSLFVAVSAGYIAGRRVQTPTPPAASSHTPDTRPVLPFPGNNPIAVNTEANDADRVNALTGMLNLQIWKFSVLPTRHASLVRYTWTIREKGKADVFLSSDGIGIMAPAHQAHDAPQTVVVSLLPKGGSLSEASQLLLRVSVSGAASSGLVKNPFKGISSWGTVGENTAPRQTVDKPTEIALFEARSNDPKGQTRTRLLILTITPTTEPK